MSDDSLQNGTENGNVPEIELIIKVNNIVIHYSRCNSLSSEINYRQKSFEFIRRISLPLFLTADIFMLSINLFNFGQLFGFWKIMKTLVTHLWNELLGWGNINICYSLGCNVHYNGSRFVKFIHLSFRQESRVFCRFCLIIFFVQSFNVLKQRYWICHAFEKKIPNSRYSLPKFSINLINGSQ